MFVERLNIQTPQDWQRVSSTQVYRLGGATALVRCGGLGKLLKKVYPDIDWKDQPDLVNSQKSQKIMTQTVRQLLPKGIVIYENYKVSITQVRDSTEKKRTEGAELSQFYRHSSHDIFFMFIIDVALRSALRRFAKAYGIGRVCTFSLPRF